MPQQAKDLDLQSYLTSIAYR